MIGKVVAVAAFGALAAHAAGARTVPYPMDAAARSAAAERYGIAVPDEPAKGTVDVALEMSPAVDHRAVRGGIVCGAWPIDNPISKLIQPMVADHNPSGKVAATSPGVALLSIKRASTLGRCFMTGELQSACVTRVTIDATLRPAGSSEEIPLRAQVEREQKAIGMCDGLAIGTGLISREAMIALLKDSDARLAAKP